MGPISSYSCNNWRITSICIGVLYTILWTVYVSLLGQNIFPGQPVSEEHTWSLVMTAVYATYICCVGNLAFSALMVFGVIKGIASYIFPWLAVHFVLSMFSISLSFCSVIIFMFTEIKGYISILMPSSILIAAVMTFSWVVVYLYCKSLIAPTQIHPNCPEKCKILETAKKPTIIQ